MRELAAFAGQYAAYAVWILSEGDDLSPFLVSDLGEGGELTMLDTGRRDRAVEAGRKMLVAGAAGRRLAAVFYDSYLHLSAGRGDALVVEAWSDIEGGGFKLAVPYRRPAEGARFWIGPPELQWCSVAGIDINELATSFFEGVERDPEAAAAWDAHLES